MMRKTWLLHGMLLSAACLFLNDCLVPAGAPAEAEPLPIVLQTTYGIKGFDLLSETTKTTLHDAGWLQRPDWGMVIKSVFWVVGPIGLAIYINRILKKDKQARLLKFKKKQPQQQADPMAQLMMMMQMQHGGGGEGGMLPEDVADGALIDQAQENEDHEVDITWNEKDILPSAKRHVLQVMLFTLRAVAAFGIVNCVNVLKDCWKGNRVPASVRKHMNVHIGLEKQRNELQAEYDKLTPGAARETFLALLARNNGWKQSEVNQQLDGIFACSHFKTEKAATRAAVATRNSDLCQFGEAAGLPLLGWFGRAFSKKK
jgi:hypothetical protein